MCLHNAPAPDTSPLLVLNAAEGRLQMLITGKGPDGEPEPRFFGQWHAPSQGAELLAPALNDACKRLRLKIQDLRRIAVVRGPGSFTGIRLALATASGLCRATGAECGGIDYLPLLAANAALQLGPLCNNNPTHEGTGPERTAQDGSSQTAPPRPVFVSLTHARRNLLHMQAFAAEKDGSLIPLTDILVLPPEEAAERTGSLSPSSSALYLFGSGLTRNREPLGNALAERGIRALMLRGSFDHPGPEALLAAALATPYGRKDIAPLYVRPADAEDNLAHIAAGLGLDPEQARARLAALTAPLR